MYAYLQHESNAGSEEGPRYKSVQQSVVQAVYAPPKDNGSPRTKVCVCSPRCVCCFSIKSGFVCM